MNQHYTKNQRTRRYIIGATPTPERHRHLGGLRCEFIKAKYAPHALVSRYRARWASPLDLYRDKEIIDNDQHQAGLRFGRAYHRAMSGEAACRERSRRIDSHETPNMSDGLQRALDCVEQTYAALSSDTVGAMIDVCAYERRQRPQRRSASCAKDLDVWRLNGAWHLQSFVTTGKVKFTRIKLVCL